MAEAKPEVILELKGGRSLSVPLEFYDTIGYLKEKVEKLHGIPISKQTFFFNGRALQDDYDIFECEIFNGSRIQLLVDAADSQDVQIATEDAPPLVEDDFMKKIEEKLPPKNIKIYVTYASGRKGKSIATTSVTSRSMDFRLEVDVHNDTVLDLKDKIVSWIRRKTVKASNMNLRLETTAGSVQLLDHDQLLRQCGVSPNCHIIVEVQHPPPADASDRVIVKIVSFRITKALAVEMKLDDTILKLKQKIHEMNEDMEVERMVLLSENLAKYDDDNQLLRDCEVIVRLDALELWVYVHETSGGGGTR